MPPFNETSRSAEYIATEYDHPDVFVAPVEGLGRGAFAREAIPAGQVLTAFVGPLHNARLISELPNDPPEYLRDHVIQVGPTEYLHGKDGLAELFNHSCDPNCFVRQKGTTRVEIVTMRDIAAGEPLTWDYAMSEDSDWYFKGCQCGATNCRETIGPYRELPLLHKKALWAFTLQWLRDRYEAALFDAPVPESLPQGFHRQAYALSEQMLRTHGPQALPRSIVVPKIVADGRYIIQTLAADTFEISDEIVVEFAAAFREVFNNEPFGQYLFYPSIGTPISAQEVFGYEPREFVSLARLDGFDPKDYPRHPQTGEEAIFWTDPQRTLQKMRAKLQHWAYLTTMRDTESGKLTGAALGRVGSLQEIFASEEWENPWYYSQLQDHSRWRDFENFFVRIQAFCLEMFGSDFCVEPDSLVFCSNCVFTLPEARGHYFDIQSNHFDSLPRAVFRFPVVSETILGSSAYKMAAILGGTVPISGIFNPQGEYTDGQTVLTVGSLEKLRIGCSLPSREVRRLLTQTKRE